ncbi:Coenzyme F420 hydrogenase/dehydrogenase, beta subunit C-terminal domain [Bacteroides oleiciplenus]|uniref:Coenzyme F420 hydrogenase/dehydrogenase, beta subunit C-terminal domain n=1 Tax=Bacteroides oleiciplenus TaxID=626931 RepID=UPI0026DAD790|nr:Coenzyme F420 hydrogenase/dehydrogenase, beta subunit C-terminal domain [Bacteroides oleiciplenus]
MKQAIYSKIDNNMFFKNISPSKSDCCGCSACEQICRNHAITMQEDEEGFLYPIVDSLLCIECSACEKVCPMLHSGSVKNRIEDTEAYAAINRNEETLQQSSSGGIFSAISISILEKEGVVYGAAFDNNLQLYHIGVEDIRSLNKLRGSKYLQSQNRNVYSEIKEQLKAGRWVYYTGTGCQVAGLKCFLRRPYSTLITSDLICHGTPSHKVFDFIVSQMEHKYKGKVIKYSFRDKSINGWSCNSSSSNIQRKDGIKHIGYDPVMNSYFNAFISNAMNRKTCYHCPFATVERTGDITLADYWGVKKYHAINNNYNGVSAILVNTENGEKLLDEIKEKITIIKTNIEWIADENKNLTEKTTQPISRDTFYQKLSNNPTALMNSFQRNKLKSYTIYHIKRICKHNACLFGILMKIRDLLCK